MTAMEKVIDTFLLKLFITGNENCPTTDAMSGTLFSKLKIYHEWCPHDDVMSHDMPNIH